MPTAWFIVPYKRRDHYGRPGRYCAMDDFTAQIIAEGGWWTETEVLGNRALVKVRASAATLTQIAAEQGIKRLPKDRLDDSLATLSPAARQAIRAELEDMGYTLAEIQARFGTDLSAYTLGDVLRFAATRRLKPRYDSSSDTIVCDGPAQLCRALAEVDAEVT
jgi:hypothetical protein